MKSLLKLAVGAAIAGAVVQLLMTQRGQRPSLGLAPDRDDTSVGDDIPQQPAQAFPTEIVADSSSVGEGSGDDRVQLPDDGRLREGPLNS